MVRFPAFSSIALMLNPSAMDADLSFPDPFAVKPGTTITAKVLQAENATLHKAKVRTKGKGFQGRGFVDFGNNKGAFIKWYRENDGDAEALTATFRYSGYRGGEKKGSNMKLTINGQTQMILFPNTAGWGTDWKTLDVPIQLKSGANIIRLTTEESGGMYFDELKIQ